MSRTEDTQVDSLEIRQAKLQGRADYEAELEDKAYNEAGEDVEFEIKATMDYFTQFKVFEGKLENINGALVENDMYIEPKATYRHGVDDVEELETFKQHAQDLVNQARGTRHENTANAISAMVTAEIPDLLQELVMLSEDSESMTF